jgi:hypothetical protein
LLHDLQLESLRTSCNVFTLPRCSSCLLFCPLMPVPVVLSFLRHSCWIAPWSLVPLLHSGPFCFLFSTTRPLWLHPLRHAGTAWQVIRLQEAANFFWDPTSPWVSFFSFQWCPTARCQSPCCFFSAPKISTEASCLGISSSSA